MLNSDITTLFCGQNVDADFTGLPPHGKMMFLIGDLGYYSKIYIMSLSHSAIWNLSIKILHKNLLHSLSNVKHILI
jgi:hypothetical protein